MAISNALFLLPLLELLSSAQSYKALSSDYKLEFVSAVFRHGDRSPVEVYPGSEYQESFWPQGFGQLTITGMQQEYHLGEIYNKLYIDTGFLSRNYTRVEVYVRSTDYDRTLMSGESMLAGMYPPDRDQQFKADLIWQPIPVHTVPQPSDNLLRGRSVYCPEYRRLLDLDSTTEEYKEMEEVNKDLFEMLERVTGVTYNLTDVWSIADELFVEVAHNLTMPPWYSEDLLDRLLPLQGYGIYLFYNTEIKQKITAGIWVKEVIDNMRMKAEGCEDVKDLKTIFYSSHDTTVAACLSIFGLYDRIQPPYSSSFNIELYSKDNEYFVKFRYRNDTFSDEFFDLTHPECSQDPCPLNELATIMEAFMITVDERNDLCMDQSTSSTNSDSNIVIIVLAALVSVCGVALILTLVVMIIILITACRHRHKINKYKQLTTTEDT